MNKLYTIFAIHQVRVQGQQVPRRAWG